VLDHVAITVSDLDVAKQFYSRALEPLEYSLAMEFPGVAGFKTPEGGPDFWLYEGENPTPVHVAFRAADRATVDAFHGEALKAGGVDNGAPGLRPQYHEHYYGAYVRDASGHNIEAVSHVSD
jgi:catechol 2,3-dioxygenase-like lactoylglutathione lyase family enzyme